MQPKLAFAYDPQLTEHVFAVGQQPGLAGLCEILRQEPLLHRAPHELLGLLSLSFV